MPLPARMKSAPRSTALAGVWYCWPSLSPSLARLTHMVKTYKSSVPIELSSASYFVAIER